MPGDLPREADFYTPNEAARLLGPTEFRVLSLLTSGQPQGRQDEQATLVDTCRRCRERSKGFWWRLFGE